MPVVLFAGFPGVQALLPGQAAFQTAGQPGVAVQHAGAYFVKRELPAVVPVAAVVSVAGGRPAAAQPVAAAA